MFFLKQFFDERIFWGSAVGLAVPMILLGTYKEEQELWDNTCIPKGISI